jgi:hypothetical protein
MEVDQIGRWCAGKGRTDYRCAVFCLKPFLKFFVKNSPKQRRSMIDCISADGVFKARTILERRMPFPDPLPEGGRTATPGTAYPIILDTSPAAASTLYRFLLSIGTWRKDLHKFFSANMS